MAIPFGDVPTGTLATTAFWLVLISVTLPVGSGAVLTQASQRFEIAIDRAPSDVAFDPNIWMLMEPRKFSRRQP